MKELSSKIGLNILLEKISDYADSKPGKQSIIALNPSLPEEKRLLSFKRLSEIKQIQHLLPNLNILEKEKAPQKGTILSGEKILYYRVSNKKKINKLAQISSMKVIFKIK